MSTKNEPLPQAMIRDLVQKAQQGDHKALADLVQYYSPDIRVSARSLASRFHLPVDDFFQVGVLGFLSAVRRFDMREDVSLRTYAHHWIKSYQIKYLFEERGRGVLRRSMYVDKIWRALRRGYSEWEVATILGVDLAHVETIAGVFGRCDSMSTEDARGVQLQDALPAPESNIEELLDRAAVITQVQDAVERLPNRMKTVLSRCWIDSEESLADVGRDIGLCRERVRQIEGDAMQRLRKILIRAGDPSSTNS